jgi:TfoX/Sxy family transcriptional regulator of competence genes
MAYDPGTAERVRKVLATRDDVVEKRLMGGLCFLVSGAMCCSVSGQGGLLVRVSPADYARMLEQRYVEPAKIGSRTMRGFIRVSPEGIRTTASLRRWVERGIDAAAKQTD